MTEITATGAAEARLAADCAEIGAIASMRGESRAQVLQDASEAHARLVNRARELVAEGAATEYVAAPVSSSSNSWRTEQGETSVEHHAFVSVRLMLNDLDRVGEISAELTEDGADVRVSWGLSAEVREEQLKDLRATAVHAARAAADDYAEALNASAVRMVSLRDVGQGAPLAPRGARLAMMADAAPEVTTGEIVVNVQIEATFTTL